MAVTYNAGTNLITLAGDGANPAGGTSWANAYDMEDVLAACGAVVTKQGANAYDVSARMQFNAGVYFVSESEFVELKPNPINPAWTIRGETGSHIRLGNYDATDKFSYNGAFWRIYVNSTTSGGYFKGETLIYGSNIWNDALGYQRAINFEPSGTTKIYNSIIQGISYMRTTDIDMQDVKWMYNAGGSHGLMVASGYNYAWSGITTMDASSGAGGFFMSGTTTSAVDMYAVKFLGCARSVNLSGGCNWLLRLINSPTFSTINTPGSGKPGAKICYTFNVRVVNAAGVGIVGAVVRLKDVDGLTVFEESTVSGGVLPTDEIVTKYWYRHTDDGGNKDFNNHTLRVSNGADVVEYVITIDHEIKEDIVLVPTPTASYDDLMTGLTDIKGTGFVKDTDSLVDIRPETDKIQTDIIATPNNFKADVTNLDVAVSTRNATTPPTVGAIKNELEGVGTKLTSVKDQTDKIQFAVGDDVKATLDSEEVTTDAASRTASKATGFATTTALSTHDTKLDAVDANVDRILKATEIKQCTVNDAGASTTKFITSLTETDNNFWDRGALRFTSGNNDGQVRAIKNYAGGTKQVTIQTPLNSVPANGDTFIILTSRKFLTPDIGDILEGITDIQGTGFVKDAHSLKPISDTVTAIVADTEAQLSGTHGAGSWEGAAIPDIADAVWDEDLSGHTTAGTAGKVLGAVKKIVNAILGLIA